MIPVYNVRFIQIIQRIVFSMMIPLGWLLGSEEVAERFLNDTGLFKSPVSFRNLSVTFCKGIDLSRIHFRLPCTPRTISHGAKLFIGTPECETM